MRYSKLDRKIWHDEKFRRLTPAPPCGQMLFIYLLSNSYVGVIPGLYSAGEAGLAEDLEWDLKDFRHAMQEVIAEGMVYANWQAKTIWIPKAIYYNPPTSLNSVKAWKFLWDELCQSDVKEAAYKVLRNVLKSMGSKWLRAFDMACPMPSAMASGTTWGIRARAIEQEQEQEQEQESTVGLVCDSLLSESKNTHTENQKNKAEAKPNPQSKPLKLPPSVEQLERLQAAQWVCQQLSLAGHKTVWIIHDVIRNELEHSTESAQTIAEMLVRCRRSYESVPHETFVYDARAFFERGIWKESRLWRGRGNGGASHAMIHPSSYEPEPAEPRHAFCLHCHKDLGVIDSADPEAQYVCSQLCAAAAGVDPLDPPAQEAQS